MSTGRPLLYLQTRNLSKRSKMILGRSSNCRYFTVLLKWKYEFQMPTFASKKLNCLDAQAEHGQDSKLSDVHRLGQHGFNRRRVVLWFEIQPLGHSNYLQARKAFVEHHSLHANMTLAKPCVCQSNVWLDDDNRFYPRPTRCVIVAQPYLVESDDLGLLKQYVFLSFVPTIHVWRVTFNEKHKNQQSIHHRDSSDHVEFVD